MHTFTALLQHILLTALIDKKLQVCLVWPPPPPEAQRAASPQVPAVSRTAGARVSNGVKNFVKSSSLA